jgi:hypothetical protein
MAPSSRRSVIPLVRSWLSTMSLRAWVKSVIENVLQREIPCIAPRPQPGKARR